MTLVLPCLVFTNGAAFQTGRPDILSFNDMRSTDHYVLHKASCVFGTTNTGHHFPDDRVIHPSKYCRI